ncbi:MAG TPA: SDR family NAD(P)-dependent oxidoreductase [Candidatus Binatia bacterium]|nr:SDR family NAD(P)-dependent oxidoreductase [Candidatus Binatia bacterium]
MKTQQSPQKAPVVLVTGASQGIGEAIANLLADEGYRVYGTARVPSLEWTRRFEMLELDVRLDSSVLSCVSTVLEREGRLDILINNAGVGMVGAIEETSMAEAGDLYQTNVLGMGRMVAAALPGMRERRRGQIINLGSVAAHLPVPYHGWLVSSKAAVSSYSDSLRMEVKHLGIKVSVLEPGAVATHPGERMSRLKVATSIEAYERHELRAVAAIERAGVAPEAVARAVLRIIRSDAPSAHYAVGREKWYVRFGRVVPYSAVESLLAHRLGLAS